MDELNDYYFDDLDLTLLKRFFREEGHLRVLAKRECLIRQGEQARGVAYVEEGIFRLTRTDADGNEHVTGYSFRDSFVAEYSSCLCNRPSLADVQAVVESHVYVVSYEQLSRFWERSPEHLRLRARVAEQLFVMAYRRLTDSYCCTPEERYVDLMRRYPELKEHRPLKEIASFIGVTPETVSAIRRKLLKGGKS